MSTIRQYTALVAVFHCICASAADGDFYRLFQSAVTNYYRPLENVATNGQSIEIGSPLLVDTKNTGFKMTNVLLHLQALKANGEPSGIRLGMTMEKVVARWGRPLGMDPHCMGFPHFIYTDAHVYFEPASNSVRAIHVDLADLARALGIWPSLEDCVGKVGRPSRRISLEEGTICRLVYQKPEGRISLSCDSGKL